MNSYNDNLHNSVVSSLTEQEIALQSITAQYNASEDTLYYTQSNRVTTFERLQLASQKLKFYQEAREKTVENNNLSINVQDAADKSKSYLDKTVSNTSSAAANVQIASNAILKLAGDVGSIFSIVNAANFGDEIYHLSSRCKERMSETAFNAEAVSDTSMEATASVSQVPITALKQRTDEVNAAIQELQGVVNAEYDKSNEKVKSESAKLEIATNAEKKAEGNLLVRQREFNSTRIAYNITNRELNLDLDVSGIDSAVDVEKQHADVVVTFQDYKSPFPDPSKKIAKDPAEYVADPYYPIDEYYLFVVKYQKQSLFALSNAEETVNQYPLDVDGVKSHDVRYSLIERADITSHSISENLSMLLQGDPTETFKPSEHNPNYLQLDTDGDPIILGQQYVIFVMGEFDKKYKKAINNFDDYLTGASENFKLEVQMPYPSDIKQKVDSGDSASDNDAAAQGNEPILFNADDKVILDELKHLGVTDQEVLKNPVQYRCMFLPVITKNIENEVLSNSMLTNLELLAMGIGSTEKDSNSRVYNTGALSDKLSRIADLESALVSEEEDLKKKIKEEIQEINDLIEVKNEKIRSLEENIEEGEKEVQNQQNRLNRVKKEETKEEARLAIQSAQKAIESHRIEIGNLTEEVLNLKAEHKNKKEAVANLTADIAAKTKEETNTLKNESEIGFIFDATIASKVSASNYTLGEKVESNSGGDGNSDDTSFQCKVEIKPETTDNFGNRLIENNHYLPVVLAVFDPGNSNKDKFGMALSMAANYITYK